MANDKKTDVSKNSATENKKTTRVVKPKKIGTLERITSYIEILSKIFGIVTWPVIVLIIFLMFYTPIKEIVELLPKKFASSSEGSLAGLLSYKIQEEAKISGNEELATIINGLSEEEIKHLITLGGTKSYRLIGSGREDSSGIVETYFLTLSDFSIWKTLEDRGLVQSTVKLNDFEKYIYSLNPTNEDTNILRFPASNLTKEQKDKLLDNSVELTDSGKRAYDIIIKVIADSIGNK